MADTIFPIPTLAECREAVKADYATRLGNDLRPEVRHSAIGVIEEVTAVREYNLLLMIQRVADASFLSTAKGDQLTRLASVFGEQRKNQTPAKGEIAFRTTLTNIGTGVIEPTASSPISIQATIGGETKRFTWSGRAIFRTGEYSALGGDSNQFYFVLSGVETVDTGETSNITESEIGTNVNLSYAGSQAGITSIVNAVSTAKITSTFTGGADLENDEVLRERLLGVIRTPIAGGTEAEWRNWALQFSGVTRAFVSRSGPSQVAVFPVFDGNTNGLPSSTNLTSLRTHLNQFKPAAVELFLNTFTPKVVAVSAKISPFNSTTQATAQTAIINAGRVFGRLGENFPLYHINNALAAAEGVGPFQLVSPTADVEIQSDELIVLNPTVSSI